LEAIFAGELENPDITGKAADVSKILGMITADPKATLEACMKSQEENHCKQLIQNFIQLLKDAEIAQRMATELKRFTELGSIIHLRAKRSSTKAQDNTEKETTFTEDLAEIAEAAGRNQKDLIEGCEQMVGALYKLIVDCPALVAEATELLGDIAKQTDDVEKMNFGALKRKLLDA
ncbi:unnamed protein product, partial [Mesorhabditis spiculigera]